MISASKTGSVEWQVIFQRYAKDVEAVQAAYERGKRRPALPRNAPPVAGHIQWARQLLRRIELPMRQCALPSCLEFCILCCRHPDLELRRL